MIIEMENRTVLGQTLVNKPVVLRMHFINSPRPTPKANGV